MEFINRMRKDKKGFTLVEIIVVLVILAILAAFMIPSMLGFVGNAKRKAMIAEQREVYVAAQAIVTERVAKESLAKATKVATGAGTGADAVGSLGVASGEAVNLGSHAVSTGTTGGTDVASEMKRYLGTDIAADSESDETKAGLNKSAYWTVSIDSDGKITQVTYKRNGVTLDPLKPSSDVN